MVVVVPQVQEKKPCDGSFVRVNSKSLIENARKTIESVKFYKKRDLQRLITRLKEEKLERIEKKRNSWWSKLFGYKDKPMPTDDQILEDYKNSGEGIWLPETFWIDFRYEKNLEVAYRLINAAKYADEVAVSTKDLERLI